MILSLNDSVYKEIILFCHFDNYVYKMTIHFEKKWRKKMKV